ncbi:hypothetical protein CLU96_1259 [Chryseobacterium sp. 52]|nr:hypothetical protein CLU96_1259 [Chryseobacterium sp. 52]
MKKFFIYIKYFLKFRKEFKAYEKEINKITKKSQS